MYKLYLNTHKNRTVMRTNIVIDDELMEEALRVSRLKTKKDAVEQGLKLLVQRKKQEQIRDLRGELPWKGDLEKMRKDDL